MLYYIDKEGKKKRMTWITICSKLPVVYWGVEGFSPSPYLLSTEWSDSDPYLSVLYTVALILLLLCIYQRVNWSGIKGSDVEKGSEVKTTICALCVAALPTRWCYRQAPFMGAVIPKWGPLSLAASPLTLLYSRPPPTTSLSSSSSLLLPSSSPSPSPSPLPLRLSYQARLLFLSLYSVHPLICCYLQPLLLFSHSFI